MPCLRCPNAIISARGLSPHPHHRRAILAKFFIVPCFY